jgi:capsid protein
MQPRISAEAPGSTLNPDYGLELMQTDPKFPIEAAHEFRQDNMRDIAVGAGVRFQDVSGDFQNLGFAAALMCSTPAQDNYKVRQKNMIDTCVRPIFRAWLKCAIMSGRFEKKYPGLDVSIMRLDEYVESARFKGKRWAFVNPLVEAQCLIIMLEAGIISEQQVQDRLPDGISIEDLYAQKAEAMAEQKKHGLNFATVDVTRPTISKGDPGEAQPIPQAKAGDDKSQPTPKTKPANPVRSNRMDTMALIAGQGDGTYRNGSH